MTIWGLSLHGWEDVMRGSLAIVGIFGFLVGISTFFVVKLQREEIAELKRGFDAYTLEADIKISEANARQKEAEERTELLRQSFDRSVMPRRLSFEIFETELKDVPPATVQVLYDSNISDAMTLATSIAITLRKLNWDVVQRRSPSLPAEPLNSLPQESIAGIAWPYWLEGRGNAWGIALISNKADHGADPKDPVNALQRAIHKSGG